MPRQPAPRPTMADVARRAGVSTATVSYVLNATAGQTITEATRKRVFDAAAAVAYVPHSPGRALREGHSRTVIAEIGDLDQGGPTLSRVLRAMSVELHMHDHSLLVTVGGDGRRAELLGTVMPVAVVDFARVTTGTELDDEVSGLSDGRHVGYPYQSLIQLRHLVERGHVNIATVIPAAPQRTMTDVRVRHWQTAARELGIPALRSVRLHVRDGAHSLVRELLALGVTAVAAYDDATALAVLAALHDHSLRSPADLAVIGFDDSPYGALWRPALSTVRVDAERYGWRAARSALGLPLDDWTTDPSVVVARHTT